MKKLFSLLLLVASFSTFCASTPLYSAQKKVSSKESEFMSTSFVYEGDEANVIIEYQDGLVIDEEDHYFDQTEDMIYYVMLLEPDSGVTIKSSTGDKLAAIYLLVAIDFKTSPLEGIYRITMEYQPDADGITRELSSYREFTLATGGKYINLKEDPEFTQILDAKGNALNKCMITFPLRSKPPKKK